MFYSKSANGNRLAVHTAESFLDLTDENLVGYYYPYGLNYLGSVDTPEVFEEDARKIIVENDDFFLMCSSYHAGWITEYIHFANFSSFLESLKK